MAGMSEAEAVLVVVKARQIARFYYDADRVSNLCVAELPDCQISVYAYRATARFCGG